MTLPVACPGSCHTVRVTRRIELVDALRQVDGVAEAEIVDDASGVGTLRLALVPGADEVSVAMEVNRVLRDGFGLGVDAGRVQVVEETWPTPQAPPAPAPSPVPPVLDDPVVAVAPTSEPVAPAPEPAFEPLAPPAFEPAVQPAVMEAFPDAFPESAPVLSVVPSVHTARVAQAGLTGGQRLSIRRLQLVSAGTGISTAVSLGLGPETFVGQADAESAVESVQHAVAVATMRAVESVAGDSIRLDIERVEVAPLGAEWVALTVVLFTEGDRTDRLTGASVVREDVRQAVIRASLDAVNRRVEDVLRRRTP